MKAERKKKMRVLGFVFTIIFPELKVACDDKLGNMKSDRVSKNR